jgi:hypothetical protein
MIALHADSPTIGFLSWTTIPTPRKVRGTNRMRYIPRDTWLSKYAAIKKKIFDHLDTFLLPEKHEYPLPKPMAVSVCLDMPVSSVYREYRKWRALHPDDFRVLAHHRKYN